MFKDTYHIIGVMSGTSLDGIDLCEIKFRVSSDSRNNPERCVATDLGWADDIWEFELGATETVAYSRFWRNELSQAIDFSEQQLERLDFKYCDLLATEISGFIRRNAIREIDAICSHGHTILHRPERKLTYQIGNLPRFSKMLDLKVVCDFRVQDVNMGGQGAPLVPVGDHLLFSEYDLCLNLGGFANCSLQKNGQRIAYDICPANIVLNHYTRKLGMEYDTDGNLARRGLLDKDVLKKLNSLAYYALDPPKSLGLEWVIENVFPLLDRSSLPVEDILRTVTEHVAMQITSQFPASGSVLVTGGGAYNSYLIERMQALCTLDLIIPSSKIIAYKEALVFGLLGVLKLRGQVNVLASVTGASKNHSSGIVHRP